MLFDNVPRDRQAEPGPTGRLHAHPCPVDLVEPFEDPRLRGPRDADPMIVHGRNQLAVRGTNPDHDIAAARAELDRVVEEVDEHLPEACLVTPGMREPWRDIDPQRHALALREEA